MPEPIVTPITAAVESMGFKLLPNQSPAEQRSVAWQEQQADLAKSTPWGELYDSGVEVNHTFINVMNAMALEGNDVDPDWELDGDKLVQDFESAGLPLDWLDEFDDTVSEAHYQRKLSQLQDRRYNEEKLMAAGGKGFAANLASSFSDPIGFAIDAATGGAAAVAVKGKRIAKIGAAALAAGTSSAAVGGLQSLTNPDYDFGDLALDATVGFVTGGALTGGGSLLRADERAELAASVYGGMRKLLPSKFGEDTGSAARVAGSRVDGIDLQTDLGRRQARSVSELLDDNAHLADLQDAVSSRFRIDGMKVVDQQHDEGRTLLRLFGSSPVGVKGDEAVNATGVVERAARHRHVSGAEFQREYKGAFRDWLRGTGADSWWRRQFSIEARNDFARSVGLHLRGATPSTDPAVLRAAAGVRRSLDNAYLAGARAGVNGMDPAAMVKDYFPRVMRPDMRAFVRDKLNPNAALSGELLEERIAPLFTQAITSGLQRAGRNVDPEVTAKVGKAYAKRLLGFSDGASEQVDRMTELRLDYLEDVLAETGMDAADVEEVLQKFTVEAMPDASKTGPSDRLKPRLELDESVSMTLSDGTELRVSDFFDNDAERVVDNYLREMSGHTALAESGFKTWREAQAMTEKLWKEGKLDDEGKQMAEIALKTVLQRPLETDPLSTSGRALRMIGDANFLRSMGSVFYSMLAENGKILGMVGFRAAMQSLPHMRGIIRQARDGTLDTGLARELAAMFAPGSSMLRSSVGLRAEDLNMPGVETGLLGKVDRTQQRLKRFQTIVSGLGPVTDVQQIFFARSMTQALYNGATGAGIDKTLRSRLRDYGMTDGDIATLTDHFRTVSKADKGMLIEGNFDKLPPGVQRSFAEAMSRATRHVIQDLDAGALPNFMHGKWGKLAMQFRTFSVGAYARHTLHGIAKRDRIAAMQFTQSMAFASIGYVAMAYVNFGGDKERLERMLTPEEIAKNSFARASDASLIPMLTDTVMGLAGEDPMFTYTRNTGMATSFVTGIPTVDAFAKLQQAAGIPMAAIRTDREVTQEQVKALASLVWLNRLPGLVMAQNVMASQFPRERDALEKQRRD